MQVQSEYWQRTLAGAPAVLELPIDHRRPVQQDHAGAFVELELDAGLTGGLKALSRRHGTTLFMTLLAGWAALLARLAGEDDVVIGTPVANRARTEIEPLIGFFVNSLALRLDLSGSPTVGELLQRVKGRALEAQQHQDLPFEQVVEIVCPPRSLAHTPVFQVMFAWQNSGESDLELPGLTAAPLRIPHSFAKFDLTLSLAEAGGRISGGLEYATALFDRVTIERHAGYLRRLLEGMVADDARAVDRLPLLSEAERHQLLVEWNATEADYPRDQCLHELFEAQAARTPNAIAVVHEQARLTYAELNARANRLAHHLRTLGVKPDARVAICVERSLEMVVGLLAILKAGAAYVPLDPAYPAQRLAYMLEDSAPVAVLTHAQAQARVPAAFDGAAAALPVIDLEADAERWAGQPESDPDRNSIGLTARHLAYVIYTSGSTGQPKGVRVGHRNIVNHMAWMADTWPLAPGNAVLQRTSISFDASVWELFAPLLQGARLVLASADAQRDPRVVIGDIIKNGVTVAQFVPSLLRAFVADERHVECQSLQAIFCGGEVLALELCLQLRASLGIRIANLYGPTEATIDAAVWVCPANEDDDPPLIPLGRPISNTRIYILDGHGEPVPIGVAGEIYIGGAGVARGYLNQPELTAERFLADPFAGEADARMYKTGDLGRYLPDGTIEFLGRNDFQVKIRGFRIEPGEIEARLTQHPAVREAVVLAREDSPGEKRLVAYYTVVPDAEAADAEALRRHLSAILPEYMVPAAYVRLDALPLTANGKLDRKALPAPDGGAYAVRGYEAPVGEIEIHLAQVWAEVLGIERVGRHDNFFELGGHSLLAVRVISRLRREGPQADVRALFATPTLSALAAARGGGDGIVEVPPNGIPLACDVITPEMLPLVSLTAPEIDRIVGAVPGGAANVQDIYPLAPLQEGILFHHLMASEGDPYVLRALLSFDSRRRLDGYLDALRAVIARHDILRTAVLWEGLAEPVQVVWRDAPLVVEEVALDPAAGDVAEQLRARFDPRRFRLDVRQAPLMQLFIAHDAVHDRWVVLELHHHLSTDHITLKVVQQEIQVRLLGRAEELPAPLPFRNFVAQARLGVSGQEHEAFFRKMLGDVEEPTAPFGLADIRCDGSGISEGRRAIDLALAKRLRARARALGVSPASLFHLAWAQVLARVSGRDDVVFGSVLFGRMQGGEGSDRVLGLFINTLPIRIRVGEDGVADGVRHTHQLLAQLLRHEHAPLVLAQRCSAVAPPAPLFTALLNYRHSVVPGGASGEALEAWEGIEHLGGEGRTNYPFVLSIDDLGEGFVLTAQVRLPLDPGRVCGYMHNALEKLAFALESAPATPVRCLDVMSSAERHQLLVEWNATEADYPRDQCVHELFEAQAARTPDAVAVMHEDAWLTYAELNARANRLAHHLRTLGVKPDARVAICVERSLEMVVGLLAILKAGGAYVPLDPVHPAERLAGTLEDSAPAVLLIGGGGKQALTRLIDGLMTKGVPAINLAEDAALWANQADANPDTASVGLTPSHLAYVIHTSGSTGRPKGVMVEHRGIVNRLTWMQRVYCLTTQDRVLQKTPFGFDVSVREIFLPFLNGACLVMARPEGHKDPAYLAEIIFQEHVTTLNFVPSMLQAFLENSEAPKCVGLRRVICAGEVLPTLLARRFRNLLPNVRLHNFYGPTETTLNATAFDWNIGSDTPSAIVPLGRPISNTRIYILDGHGEPVPIGVAGEIYIGGAGVARGYLNQPELTAERFLADPFAGEADARMYKTGDLGRYLPDGTIEFLGRNDFQVKIRGFRIEPGEIEARLTQHPAVREAVVLAREDGPGDKRLVAYYTVVPDAEAADAEALRRHLSAILPEYMVPAAYVRLDALPLTANGKLDRKALPAPDGAAYAMRGYEAPVGEIEMHLAQIWAEVLGIERVGRHDNFFELGGHSLLTVRVISRLRQALSVEVALAELFARPVLADFAEAVREGARTTLPPITAARRDEPLPLSFAQQRLWFLAQMEGVSQAYHIVRALRLTGELDRGALRRALDRLVARHEALRTTFCEADDQLVQRIAAEDTGFDLQEHDLRQQRDAEGKLGRLAIEEANAAFDLRAGPLIRGRLIRLADREYVLLITMHHIVSDGWSMGVLIRELGALYRAYSQGEAGPLPPALAIQYPDYAVWQRRWLAGDVLQAQSEYWQRTLAGAPAVLELPIDHRRPVQQDHAGAFVELELDAGLTAGLKALSRRHGTTLFMTLLAGWAALLARLAGEDDVVIGTPVANRARTEIEPLIGFFVNSLALRLDLSGSPTVGELLQRVKGRALEAQQHQDLPFEQVVEIVCPPRSLAHTPVFQVMFAWQNSGESDLELPGLTAAPLRIPHSFAKFDLTLSLAEAGGRISGGLEYATALFDRATIERHAGYLRGLLEGMVADDARAVDRLPLLSEAERHQLLVEWNATEADYPRDQCLHELFEAQAARTPNAIAVVHEQARLTYAELNARANRLAHHLRTLGVKPDVRVAIGLEHSLELVVAELAILKCGAAYVPLDQNAPIQRQTFMIEDCQAQIVLTAKGQDVPEIAGVKRVDVDELTPTEQDDAAVLVASDATAYVMYTSGSTGQPKGVMVPHRAVGRLVLNNGYANFQAGDRVAFAANPAFDASTMEVWAPLLNGGCIVVIDQATLIDLERFKHRLKHDAVNVLWLTAALFNQYADILAETFSRLRYLIVGGDVVDPQVMARVMQRSPPQHLINGYGPTETTTFAVTHEIREVPAALRSIPLGRPISNTRIYILDGHGEPVPIGVAGEIYIGGAGVARGYLNQPELTAERFLADPFAGEADARMYKTGDLGRYLPNGTIEFLGRNDFQVKIRGFRIEPGEIEARLTQHPAVREAVVLAREDSPGEKRLVAYYTVVPDAEAADAEALRRHLSAILPEYMVPAAYVRLDALPLTANGKLDRKALPAPDGAAYAMRGYEAPVGEIEMHLAQIWAEVLGIERVGRHDNFFELGGHSLLTVRVISRLRQALSVEVALAELFARPVLADFAEAVREGARTTLPPITAARRDEPLPLSSAQQRLWFLAQMEGVSQAYHIVRALRLTGELDRGALRRALDRLVARHEALRTTFCEADDQLVQRIAAEDTGFDLQEHDLRQQRDAEGKLGRLAIEEANAAFDLRAGPLIRGRLIRLADREYVLLITMHHIVSDGWSMGVLIRELGALYRAYSQGEAGPLPPALAIQYPDYAVWQRRWLAGDVLQAQSEYWQRTLAGAPAVLELPIDHRRPVQQDHAGAFVELELDAGLTAGLKALSRRHGTTLFMTLLAGWAALLARLAGEDDVVIGTPVANRARTEIEPLIGFFVNSLALRLDLSGSPTVGELLQRVKGRALEAQQHQDLPFEQVVEIVCPPRSLAHTPVFQVMFAWQNSGESDLELPGLTAAPLRIPPSFAKFDLTLSLAEAGGRISGGLEYATALFDRATIERHAGYLRGLLEGMVADDARAVDRLPLLSEAERHQLLVEWNATEADYPRDQCLHELFEAQAARTPNAIAVVHEQARLTYAELNARANRLAHHLRTLGVKPDALVAIAVERSLEMVVGLLAILKAGGAYVPLDPAYPAERLAYMLEDSAPVAILTLTQARDRVPVLFGGGAAALPVIDLAADAECWAGQPESNPDSSSVGLTSRHLAYVMYTSGSTGKPKGVMIEHENIVNHMAWVAAKWPLDPSDAMLQRTPISFDASVRELFAPLLQGTRLVLASPDAQRDPRLLIGDIVRNGVTVAQFVPSLLRMFVADDRHVDCTSLRVIRCGGEALAPELCLQVRTSLGVRVTNLYGPTEATIAATAWTFPANADDDPPSIPLGRPISNMRIYILDRHGEPVPIGVAGEIYIGGAGVARGYLNRPELTAERFLADPFAEEAEARMYRTGDLGRYLPDGTIEFLGRNDFQVKIRGYRIELGEIEARLVQHPAVREAVVLAREDGSGKRLVAYTTGAPDAGDPGAEALRRHLSAGLPEYMVPVAYVRLDALPLTANGKLDRKALPAPEDGAYAAHGYVAPVGETEAQLARIWADVLGIARVGRHDNFFELGGHSLLAMRMISRLRQKLGVDVALTELFVRPVLAEFAEAVGEGAQSPLPPITSAGRDEPLPLSFAQQRLWFLAQMEGVSQAYHMAMALRLTGDLDGAALRRALNRLVARHEALRTTFGDADGQPFQRIATEDSGFHLREHDLRQKGDGGDALQRLTIEEANRAFDLQAGPLIRGRLIRLADREYVLLITMHHIVSDGWSMGVLIRELGVLYRAYSLGETDPLPALAIQYPDYAVWQRRWLAGEILEAQGNYWRRVLAGAPAVLELPTDRRRPVRQHHAGAFVELDLDDRLSAGLKALSQRHGTTLFMTLLAGWAALLARLSGQDDVVIGTPVANRGRAEVEPLIGFFVNSLAVRLDLSGNPTVSGLLQRTKARALEAQQHQNLPFEQVVEITRPPRSLSHTPVFQVMFAWSNTGESDLELPGLNVAPVKVPHSSAKFDLTLSLAEAGGRVTGGLEYATALFDRATVERHAGYLHRILEGMVADDAQPVALLPLLSDAERRQLLSAWNATEADYPRDTCVHELFEAQAARTPDAIAVVREHAQLTYAELNARANRLAHHLRTLGVKPNTFVAIAVERSIELAIAELAILKCGAAYVPLDQSAPLQRQAFMVKDCRAQIILTGRRCDMPEMTGVKQVDVLALTGAGLPSHNPAVAVDSETAAYVMYTSGSTGLPKGVLIPHRAIGRLVLNNGYASFQASDRVAFAANPAFDASTMEVWAPLLNGGCIVVIDQAILLDPERFKHQLEHDAVNVLWLTVALFNQYADILAEAFARLRYLIVGGDVLDSHTITRVLQRSPPQHLINGYGPTETTTFAITHEVRAVPAESTSIPIGRPISNTRIYILDRYGEPVPIGVMGEIYIGGAGVARGYLNQPTLTAERFVADPFAGVPDARMYKTGDLGRYLPDGTIEFLGRNDFQVKIRGYRIELGEIEARLAQHPAVREAVVLAREDGGGKRLVAYCTMVPDVEAADAEALRRHLSAGLPDYMVPAAYVRLTAMPLTANGKLDRKALPAPEDGAYAARGYEAPVGEAEAQLARIWADVLGIARVGRHDNFFELGGHSLLALQLVARVAKAFGVPIPIAMLFEAPTVQDFAGCLPTGEAPLEPWTNIVKIQPVGDKTPIIAINHPMVYYKLARKIGMDRPFFGVQLIDPSEPPPSSRRKLNEIAADFVNLIRATQPHGPYILFGLCVSGLLAFEAARQLRREGEQVPLVIVADSWAPGYLERLPFIPRFFFRWSNVFNGLKHHLEIIRIGKARVTEILVSYGLRVLRMSGILDLAVALHLIRDATLGTWDLGDFVVLPDLDEAREQYRASESAGKLVLLKSDRVVTRFADPKMGWSALVNGELLVYRIPGWHADMYLEGAELIAEHLRPLLDQVDAERDRRVAKEASPACGPQSPLGFFLGG